MRSPGEAGRTDRRRPVLRLARYGTAVHRGWHPVTLSAGIGVTTFVSACAGYALSTTLPVAAHQLAADRYLGWLFAVYLSGEVLGICLAPSLSRRGRPWVVQGLASALLVTGLCVAATADHAWVLITGRWMQGVGAGVVLVVVYELIARCYPPTARPRLIALTSAALIIPGMVGPSVAGAMTSHWGWRSVFVALVVGTVLSAVLVIVPTRHMPRGAAPERSSFLMPAVVAFLALTGVQASGLVHSPLGIVVFLASIAALVLALRRLLPTGVLALRPSVPALVGLRFLLSAAYFGGQIWIPTMLIQVHRLSPEHAGLVMLGAPLGWAAGAMWQSRGFATASSTHRRRRVAFGSLISGAGMGVLLIQTLSGLPLLLLGLLWTMSATGMGIANSTVTTGTLHAATEHDAGVLSMAIQLADSVGSALAIALGTLVREINPFAGQARAGLAVIFAGAASLCLLAAVASRRLTAIPRPLPAPACGVPRDSGRKARGW